MNTLFFPLPQNISFQRWASMVSEELSQYNIGIPTSEDAWLSWALGLYEISELEAEGLPNPNGFSDWRSWAERLSTVANG